MWGWTSTAGSNCGLRRLRSRRAGLARLLSMRSCGRGTVSFGAASSATQPVTTSLRRSARRRFCRTPMTHSGIQKECARVTVFLTLPRAFQVLVLSCRTYTVRMVTAKASREGPSDHSETNCAIASWASGPAHRSTRGSALCTGLPRRREVAPESGRVAQGRPRHGIAVESFISRRKSGDRR